MKVTDEQILKFVEDYTKQHGYPPSFRDIGGAMGIVSAGSVKYRVARLREKGLLTYEDNRPRTIRLVNR